MTVFDGENVDGYRVTLRQKKVHVDVPILVDQMVDVLVRARVTQVSHEVNHTTGELYRTHVLAVIEMEVLA